jgi:ABC-type lipoprotein release transport system permease subunit
METFIVWISVIGAICIGVMALTVFFTLLNAIQRRLSKTAIINVKGIFKTSEWLNVHLNGSKTVERVKFIGFTDPNSMKGVPYQLNNMVVFETAAGKRVLLRADTIRMIEELHADS